MVLLNARNSAPMATTVAAATETAAASVPCRRRNSAITAAEASGARRTARAIWTGVIRTKKLGYTEGTERGPQRTQRSIRQRRRRRLGFMDGLGFLCVLWFE